MVILAIFGKTASLKLNQKKKTERKILYIYTYIIGMYVVKFKNGVRADIWVQFQYVRIDIFT